MMNKRIKQLAKQSGFSTELSEAMTTRHNMASGLEKFAEHIVLECCQMMVDLEGKYPVNLTVREIKQHFGITVKQHAAAEWPKEL